MGFVAPSVLGTPVNIMVLVDPTLANDPSTNNTTGPRSEFTRRVTKITFQGMKPGAAHGTQNNTGRVYVVRKNGSRDDTGSIVLTVLPGETQSLTVDQVMNNLSPYRYWLDVDNIGDGAFITLWIR